MWSKRKILRNKYNIIILILVIIILLQRCGGGKPAVENQDKPKIDTITKYVYIHDTIPGKPRVIRSKKDTVWRDSLIYVPSENYDSLLLQYQMLGDKLFMTTVYESEFKLGNYGKAKVIDTVRGNQLIANRLSYDIKIPEKEVRVVEPAKPVRQVYIGTTITGSQFNPINGIYLGGLYKDRKDRIFGASVGYGHNQLQFGASSYWKIKLR